MADYISREAAIEKITALINESGKYTAYESGADDACYIVEHEVPAADVRPVVRGKWLDVSGDQKCSVCGTSFPDLYPLYDSASYCPNCGADMREVTP